MRVAGGDSTCGVVAMINPGRVRRLARQYREHLATWRPRPLTAADWQEQKMKAQARMAEQDRLISVGRGEMGRTTEAMRRAGPLLTERRAETPRVMMSRFVAGMLTAEDLV